MKWPAAALACLALAGHFPLKTLADMPPLPASFTEKLPDGSDSPALTLTGSCDEPRMMTDEGYVVVNRERDGAPVYAVLCDKDGDGIMDLCETDYVVGQTNPDTIPELHKDIHASQEALLKHSPHMMEPQDGINEILAERKKAKQALSAGHDETRGHFQDTDAEEDEINRNLAIITSGPMKNLVLCIRFNDHRSRSLPTMSQINTLFNHDGPYNDQYLAKTGSVRDVFKFNSYGALDLQSEVYGWVDVPFDEAYYADGYSGMSGKFSLAITHALQVVDDDPNISFKDFDENNDNKIDAIAIITSGYGAEWGGVDCQTGKAHAHRIWSHKWLLSSSTSGYFPSKTGVHINKYHVSPGLWGVCGNQPGRIGVIAHETGHFMGLPDLYDGGGGAGIGSFGLMANSWGFDNSQYYPPMMCPWSKEELGWLNPTLLVNPGTYDLVAAHTLAQVYKLEAGYPSGEYLLIENRQRHPSTDTLRFEDKLPIQGGLVIWHIDEDSGNTVEGYPGQYGWPGNGKHYRVALLSPDGEYKLERGQNRGDAGDFFHAGGAFEIGPYGCKHVNNPNTYITHPNTNAYGDGVYSTGHRIHTIGAAAQTMTFKFGEETLAPPTKSPTPAPSPIPTRLPTATKNSLRTTYAGGNGKNGNMFDVEAKVNLKVTAFDIHTTQTSADPAVTCIIYARPGTHVGYETSSSGWTKLGEVNVIGSGVGMPTLVTGFTPYDISANQKHAFYVYLTTSDMEYSNGASGTWDQVIYENAHLKFFQGTGNGKDFSTSNYRNRIFNGEIVYEHGGGGPPPTPPATPAPTNPITPPPTSEPTETPPNIYLPRTITTTYQAGNGQAGNMFDLFAFVDIVVHTFDIHVDTTDWITGSVYTKEGSYVGYERDDATWGPPMCTFNLQGQGPGAPTHIPEADCTPVSMAASTTRAFYVTLTTTSIEYTNGPAEGTVYAENADIAFMVGKGNRYPYSRSYSQRIFNGSCYYTVVDPAAGPAGATVYPTGGSPEYVAGAERMGDKSGRDGFAGGVCPDPGNGDPDCPGNGVCVEGKCKAEVTKDDSGGGGAKCAVGNICMKGRDCCTNQVCKKKRGSRRKNGKRSEGQCAMG